MYNWEIFNKKRFFLKFNSLRFSLLPKGYVKDQKQQFKVEEPYRTSCDFLYRANFAYEFLERMKLLNNAIIKQFNILKPKLSLNSNEIIFGSPLIREYLSHIMPFLNTMFILQDRIMPLIAKASNITIKMPNKFSEYFNTRNRPTKSLLYFNQNIQVLAIKYWKERAKILRKYRNKNQHELSLLSHTFFQLKPKEKLTVLLPDVINVKVENFKYQKKIDAFNFLKKEFREFNYFVEKLSSELGFEPKIHNPESPVLPPLSFKNYKDNSTFCIFVADKNLAFELIKGKGFPFKVKINPIPITKRIIIERQF